MNEQSKQQRHYQQPLQHPEDSLVQQPQKMAPSTLESPGPMSTLKPRTKFGGKRPIKNPKEKSTQFDVPVDIDHLYRDSQRKYHDDHRRMSGRNSEDEDMIDQLQRMADMEDGVISGSSSEQGHDSSSGAADVQSVSADYSQSDLQE